MAATLDTPHSKSRGILVSTTTAWLTPNDAAVSYTVSAS